MSQDKLHVDVHIIPVLGENLDVNQLKCRMVFTCNIIFQKTNMI